jgi:hypothetical protein
VFRLLASVVVVMVMVGKEEAGSKQKEGKEGKVGWGGKVELGAWSLELDSELRINRVGGES